MASKFSITGGQTTVTNMICVDKMTRLDILKPQVSTNRSEDYWWLLCVFFFATGVWGVLWALVLWTLVAYQGSKAVGTNLTHKYG